MIRTLEDIDILAKEFENDQFICVFCGSSEGRLPEYTQAADELASILVKRNYGLVYGGGSGGIMGRVAQKVASLGGKVISVYPKGFKDFCEVPFATKNVLVDSMHTRKRCMAKLSVGFFALPGGLGTFEEIMEMATWNQLGIHSKFLGLINVKNFFTPLKQLIVHAHNENFISLESQNLIHIHENIDSLFEAFDQFDPKAYSTNYEWD